MDPRLRGDDTPQRYHFDFMKISYNWLQTHFKETIPDPDKIADGLIFHSFEVESVEKVNEDTVFDIKILPDRAHDCLCHLGIAREISAIFEMESPRIPTVEIEDIGSSSGISITIEDPQLCRRYVGRIVRNIEVKDSPTHQRELLESIGQKSINNIVDAANYVMFEIGQPLHAFDLDKIKGGIVVRNARGGEKIITLDDKEIELNEENLIIADDIGPLAIAGVKGGKRAGVTRETKNILLESANFDPVSIRRTSSMLSLRTDASKRFENDFPEILAERAIRLFSGLIKESLNNDIVFEDIIDIFPNKRKFEDINFTLENIVSVLGLNIKEEEVVKILKKLGIDVAFGDNESMRAIVPPWRLDLTIKEDLAEEVGRIYGYEKIPNVLPKKAQISSQNKDFLVSGKIREFLFESGFSEIMGYSFTSKGDIEVLNPLASDKGFLRKNITEQFEKEIEFNLRNSIFSDESVKIFEIGNVFNKDAESARLCIGIGYKTKKLNKGKEILKNILSNLFLAITSGKEVLPVIFTEKDTYTVAEFSLADLLEISSVDSFDRERLINKNINYKKISEYPRVVRDIALFVSPEIEPVKISETIKEVSGELLFGEPILFDVFEKKDESGKIIKKSLAWRMIYQSYERTLIDEEINLIMLKITKELEDGGFEVRK